MHNNVRLTAAQASRLVSLIAVGGKLPRRDPVDLQLIRAGWCIPALKDCVRTVPEAARELYETHGTIRLHLLPKDWENPF